MNSTFKNSSWIYSQSLDVIFSFGGIVISLLLFIVCKKYEYLFGIIFWCWVLFFDAPHLFITYLRTYFKKEFYFEKKVFLISVLLLVCPLLFFIEPIKGVTFGRFTLLENFLFFAQLWGFWHIVSQHYGFFSLYARKDGVELTAIPYTKLIFYLPYFLFYLFFLFFHPYNAKLIGSETLLIIWGFKFILLTVLLVMFVLVCKHKFKIYLTRAPKAFFYYSIYLGYYGLVFIVLSTYEPLYKLANTPTQFFMFTSLMITLPHNLQYLFIVAVYLIKGNGGVKRYTVVLNSKVMFGVLLFSSLIWMLGYMSNEFVRLNDSGNRADFLSYATFAYGLWWGFKLQHYYLDQKIWRFRNDEHLKKIMQVPT